MSVYQTTVLSWQASNSITPFYEPCDFQKLSPLIGSTGVLLALILWLLQCMEQLLSTMRIL